VNKVDLVSPQALQSLVALLSTLNPTARIETCSRGKLDLNRVINTGLFSFGRARAVPGWLQVLRGSEQPETLEYGIGSTVYRSKAPLDPKRLAEVLKSPPFSDAIIRSKGIVYLASKNGHEFAYTWSGAGHIYVFSQGFQWLCRADPSIPVDCHTEVVLIGFFTDPLVPESAKKALDSCAVVAVDPNGQFSDLNQILKVNEGEWLKVEE